MVWVEQDTLGLFLHWAQNWKVVFNYSDIRSCCPFLTLQKSVELYDLGLTPQVVFKAGSTVDKPGALGKDPTSAPSFFIC